MRAYGKLRFDGRHTPPKVTGSVRVRARVLNPEEVLVAYFETQPDLEGIQILARECLQALKEAGFVTIKVDQCRSENEPVE
jgi:hypothetical protein